MIITLKPPIFEEKFVRCKHPSYEIHHSDEFPTYFEQQMFSLFEYGTQVDIEVIPEVIRTDKVLLNLKPTERECYLPNERKLKFFKIYSQKNCEIECFTNYTIDACNCTTLFQPYNPSKGINHCKIQNPKSVEFCYEYAKSNLAISDDFSIERNCSCLPTCDSVKYQIKYSTEIDGSNETTIRIRMNMDDLISYRRYQQFTFSDVVSYVGGLLGLFAGISMLSIVEIFYFFIIRPVVDLYRALRHAA
jgi:amiloride-sensitive sodium channel